MTPTTRREKQRSKHAVTPVLHTQRLMATALTLALAFLVWPACTHASLQAHGPRRILSFDGPWQIEQGGMHTVPRAFSHAVVVPGLADMAQPAFQDVGKKSPLRDAVLSLRPGDEARPAQRQALLSAREQRHALSFFRGRRPRRSAVARVGRATTRSWPNWQARAADRFEVFATSESLRNRPLRRI